MRTGDHRARLLAALGVLVAGCGAYFAKSDDSPAPPPADAGADADADGVGDTGVVSPPPPAGDAGQDVAATPSIHCGSTVPTCVAGTQTCCATSGANACEQAGDCTCVTVGTCAAKYTRFDCDDDTDCTTGLVCCGFTFPGDPLNVQQAICVAPANCTGLRVCDPASLTPRCPDAGTSDLLTRYAGVGYCK